MNLQRIDNGDFEEGLEESQSLYCILNVDLYLTLERAREEILQKAIQEAKLEAESVRLNTEN